MWSETIWRDMTVHTLPAKDSLLSPVFPTLFSSRTNTYLNFNHPSNSVHPETWRELSYSLPYQDRYLCIYWQNGTESQGTATLSLSWTEQGDQRRAQPGSEWAAPFSSCRDKWLHCTFPPFFFLCHLLISTIHFVHLIACLYIMVLLCCVCTCVYVCAPFPLSSPKQKTKNKKMIWDKLSKHLFKLKLYFSSLCGVVCC